MDSDIFPFIAIAVIAAAFFGMMTFLIFDAGATERARLAACVQQPVICEAE